MIINTRKHDIDFLRKNDKRLSKDKLIKKIENNEILIKNVDEELIGFLKYSFFRMSIDL